MLLPASQDSPRSPRLAGSQREAHPVHALRRMARGEEGLTPSTESKGRAPPRGFGWNA